MREVQAAAKRNCDEGVEAALHLISEIPDKVISAVWVSVGFVFVNTDHHLQCLVAGESSQISHLGEKMFYLRDYLLFCRGYVFRSFFVYNANVGENLFDHNSLGRFYNFFRLS